jgi:hypothetical protein
VPIEEIKAADGVTKDTNPSDSRAGVVGHNIHVICPRKIAIEIDA